jgi:AcrR family transcriptional regulator
VRMPHLDKVRVARLNPRRQPIDSSATPAPRRADARRNSASLLTAADAVFREQGTSAPLELIARQAGVAIGTLYKHFPTRRALVSALLRVHNDTLFTLGRRLTGHFSPEEAIIRWTEAVITHAATYEGLAAMIADGRDNATSELHDACQQMYEITEQLTARAVHAGVLRPDVTASDLLTLASAAAWTQSQTGSGQAGRLASFALAGMKPSPSPGRRRG